MGFENLKDIFKSKAKNDAPVPEPPADEEDDSNAVTHMRGKEPAVKGLKRKYVYYAVAGFAAITLSATVIGLSDDADRAAKKEAAAQTELKNSQAVEGDHLLNIPKDYKAQAEAEAKRKAEQEAKEAAEKKAQEAADKKKARESAEEPTPPTVPQQPRRYTGRQELSPAEKARLAREEKRLQALESPIGFEIQNKNKVKTDE